MNDCILTNQISKLSITTPGAGNQVASLSVSSCSTKHERNYEGRFFQNTPVIGSCGFLTPKRSETRPIMPSLESSTKRPALTTPVVTPVKNDARQGSRSLFEPRSAKVDFLQSHNLFLPSTSELDNCNTKILSDNDSTKSRGSSIQLKLSATRQCLSRKQKVRQMRSDENRDLNKLLLPNFSSNCGSTSLRPRVARTVVEPKSPIHLSVTPVRVSIRHKSRPKKLPVLIPRRLAPRWTSHSNHLTPSSVRSSASIRRIVSAPDHQQLISCDTSSYLTPCKVEGDEEPSEQDCDIPRGLKLSGSFFTPPSKLVRNRAKGSI